MLSSIKWQRCAAERKGRGGWQDLGLNNLKEKKKRGRGQKKRDRAMETLWRPKQFGVHFTFWTIPLPLCAEQGIVAGLSRFAVTWWLLPPAFSLSTGDAWWDWSVVLRWLFILRARALLFAFTDSDSVSAPCWSTFASPLRAPRPLLVFLFFHKKRSFGLACLYAECFVNHPAYLFIIQLCACY